MSSIVSQLESILLYAAKPMKEQELLKAVGAKKEELDQAILQLKEKYNQEGSGINVMHHDASLQFVTAPDHAELIENVFASEMTGELTKPALETLTIIAYRGPITKPELELIRGVNCSLILRNLAMRGLVTESQGKAEMLPSYQASPEFLQYLGMTSVDQLPKFEELSSHQLLEELLKHRSEQDVS